jgi:hypothetical protein
MRRIFSHPVTPLAFGLCLRLLFVLRFPATSGDTVLYEQMATNWLKHGVYAMDVNGAIQAVDLRMPGYPAYLALVGLLTGKTGEAARLWVMPGQIAVDLLGCLVIAALASLLFVPAGGRGSEPKRVFLAALWLAVLCPFTANYTAVPLTEVFAVFLTGSATLWFLLQVQVYASGVVLRLPIKNERLRLFVSGKFLYFLFFVPGFLVGLATLFRPESPLLLVAGVLVLVFLVARPFSLRGAVQMAALSGCAFVLPLLPWAIRNFVTLHEVQFLSPKNSNLPGELVPYGFMAWERTWLFRVKDCYLVPWKLNGESIDVETIPARAFDSAEEKQRVAAILAPYNEDLTLTKEEDDGFAQLARERTARHPLRTYVWLPALRGVTMWFAPRIELLPVSGTVFPLAQSWQDDKVDQTVTIGMFLLNCFYVGLALWGGWRLWHAGLEARPAVMLLLVFIGLRTAFLTTLETPEPRYVLECFPAVIALGAQAFRRETNQNAGTTA